MWRFGQLTFVVLGLKRVGTLKNPYLMHPCLENRIPNSPEIWILIPFWQRKCLLSGLFGGWSPEIDRKGRGAGDCKVGKDASDQAGKLEAVPAAWACHNHIRASSG